MNRAALAGFACLWLIVPGFAPSAGRTAVGIVHNSSLDAACASFSGYAIHPAWRDELDRRLPEMRKAWLQDGRPVLGQALRMTGLRIGGRRDVRLTLCDLPSSSILGPVVNARHALASFTAYPVPLRYKASVATHELLHAPLAEIDLSESQLRKAHSRESRRVRDHLHLFALMKAAMIDLGREGQLAELRRIDSQLPDGAYKRAWELVDATPTRYLRYVDEIRATRRSEMLNGSGWPLPDASPRADVRQTVYPSPESTCARRRGERYQFAWSLLIGGCSLAGEEWR